MKHKLGRKPRAFDPRIPQWRDVVRGFGQVPGAVTRYVVLPSNMGMMLNDQLGDCTAAAVGHAQQFWTDIAAGTMVTPSDADVELLYEKTGGYVPGDPSTDNGAVCQEVLAYWLNNPVASNELSAYVEVNVNDRTSIEEAIYEAGLVYIGFEVPAYLPETPGSVWAIDTNADNTIVGGHCVVVVGYDLNYVTVISWGALYTMTWGFWQKYVDEAYALVDAEWIEKTGATPAGLSLPELESLMQALRGGNGLRHWHHKHMKKRRKRLAEQERARRLWP
jgi:hypothetical protein